MADVVARRPAIWVGFDASAQRTHLLKHATGGLRELRFLFGGEVHFHGSQGTGKLGFGQLPKGNS